MILSNRLLSKNELIDIITSNPLLSAMWEAAGNKLVYSTIFDAVQQHIWNFWWLCDVCGTPFYASVYFVAQNPKCACPVCRLATGFLKVGYNTVIETDPEIFNYYSNSNIVNKRLLSGPYIHAMIVCPICQKDFPVNGKRLLSSVFCCKSCESIAKFSIKKYIATINITHPTIIMNEWDPQNTYDPEDLTYNSEYFAIWNCSHCHNSYRESVKNRLSSVYKCPYCQDEYVLHDPSISLSSMYPEIASIYSVSNDLPPEKIYYDSRVFRKWICKICNNEYISPPYLQVHNLATCPFCSPLHNTITQNSENNDNSTAAYCSVMDFLLKKNEELKDNSLPIAPDWTCRICGESFNPKSSLITCPHTPLNNLLYFSEEIDSYTDKQIIESYNEFDNSPPAFAIYADWFSPSCYSCQTFLSNNILNPKQFCSTCNKKRTFVSFTNAKDAIAYLQLNHILISWLISRKNVNGAIDHIVNQQNFYSLFECSSCKKEYIARNAVRKERYGLCHHCYNKETFQIASPRDFDSISMQYNLANQKMESIDVHPSKQSVSTGSNTDDIMVSMYKGNPNSTDSIDFTDSNATIVIGYNEKSDNTSKIEYFANWICPYCLSFRMNPLEKQQHPHRICPICHNKSIYACFSNYNAARSYVDKANNLLTKMKRSIILHKTIASFTNLDSYYNLVHCNNCNRPFIATNKFYKMRNGLCLSCHFDEQVPDCIKLNEQLYSEWDYIANYLIVCSTGINEDSNISAWWRCPSDHLYKMPLNQRFEKFYLQEVACKYCNGYRDMNIQYKIKS